MDLEEQFFVLLGRDAFHKHSYHRGAAFVKFVVDGDKHLGTSGDPSCLHPVSWEDLVQEVGQMGRPPVSGVDCHCADRGSRSLHCEAAGAPGPSVGGRLVRKHQAGAPKHWVGWLLRWVWLDVD
jgi:hypothetical protein